MFLLCLPLLANSCGHPALLISALCIIPLLTNMRQPGVFGVSLGLEGCAAQSDRCPSRRVRGSAAAETPVSNDTVCKDQQLGPKERNLGFCWIYSRRDVEVCNPWGPGFGEVGRGVGFDDHMANYSGLGVTETGRGPLRHCPPTSKGQRCLLPGQGVATHWAEGRWASNLGWWAHTQWDLKCL